MAIKDKLINPNDVEIIQPNLNPQIAPSVNLEPTLNPMMKCPLPPISVSPDSLRQYYRGGMFPQKRLFGPSNNLLTGGGTGGTTTQGNTENISVPPAVINLQIKQTAIVTPSLGVGQVLNAVTLLGKAFQIIGMAASSPTRIQLYGSAQARSLDAFRPIDVPPDAGTAQGIICDLVLDTSPLTWQFQNLTGDNGDAPQTNVIYASITNLGPGNQAITATILYLPFVN
jgi:hypothetical protein